MTPSDGARPSTAWGKSVDVLETVSHDIGEFDNIMDRVVSPLTQNEFQQFEELLGSASEPNEALRRFVGQRPPWNREP